MSIIPWWSENSRANPAPAGWNELFWTHRNTIDLVWWGPATLRLVFREKTRKFRVEITARDFKGVVYLKPNGSLASHSPFNDLIPAMFAPDQRATSESPCSPITSARVSSRETPSSLAMYVLKRIESKMLPIPKRQQRLKPVSLNAI